MLNLVSLLSVACLCTLVWLISGVEWMEMDQEFSSSLFYIALFYNALFTQRSILLFNNAEFTVQTIKRSFRHCPTLLELLNTWRLFLAHIGGGTIMVTNQTKQLLRKFPQVALFFLSRHEMFHLHLFVQHSCRIPLVRHSTISNQIKNRPMSNVSVEGWTQRLEHFITSCSKPRIEISTKISDLP